MRKRIGCFLLVFLMLVGLLAGCGLELPDLEAEPEESTLGQEFTTPRESTSAEETTSTGELTEPEENASEPELPESGEYTSKDEVALYLHLYGHLPSNFITKQEARELGWESKEGNLWQVAPGKSIGGDYFGNYEGLLPEAEGREYHECDIDSDGSYRGGKRIIYSNDGLIFYTEDHYETFEQLYGGEA